VVSHNTILSANEQIDFVTLFVLFFCSFTDKILNSCTDAPIGAPARTWFYARAIHGAGIILKKNGNSDIDIRFKEH